jgi:hypothetical protein
MLVAAFAAFFTFIIAYNRTEFVISKDETWMAAQDKDKVAAQVQDVTSHLQSGRPGRLNWLWRRLGCTRCWGVGLRVARTDAAAVPCAAACHVGLRHGRTGSPLPCPPSPCRRHR